MNFNNGNTIVLSLYLAFILLIIGNSLSFIHAQVKNTTIKNANDTMIKKQLGEVICGECIKNAPAFFNPEHK